MKRFVYEDNAATTPVSQTVLNAMLPYYTEKYGNPSSLYAVGREAKKALEEARENVANHLGALPNEIFFTSGGSEADNWATSLPKKVRNILLPLNLSTMQFFTQRKP